MNVKSIRRFRIKFIINVMIMIIIIIVILLIRNENNTVHNVNMDDSSDSNSDSSNNDVNNGSGNLYILTYFSLFYYPPLLIVYVSTLCSILFFNFIYWGEGQLTNLFLYEKKSEYRFQISWEIISKSQ